MSAKLERIQLSAIKSALGYRRTTPSNIVIAESKLTFLEDRAKYLCNRLLTKTLSNVNSLTCTTIKKLYYILRRKSANKPKRLMLACIIENVEKSGKLMTMNNVNIYTHDYNTLITTIPASTKLGKKLQKSNNADFAFNKHRKSKSNTSIAIFTDGSKSPEANFVGAACYSPDLNLSVTKSINRDASIYTAECIAMLEAFNLAIKTKQNCYHIYSDSLSVIISLQSISISVKVNPIILEIKQKYNELLSRKSKVKLYWIPSHVGISGNETVDELAKAATLSNKADIGKIHYTDYYSSFKKILIKVQRKKLKV